MKVAVESRALPPECHVAFEHPLEFVDCYLNTLRHGGLYTPCITPLPITDKVTIWLALPAVDAPLELSGSVVHSAEEGMTLKLDPEQGPGWHRVAAYADMSLALAREIKAGRSAPLSPMTARKLPTMGRLVGHTHTWEVGFSSIRSELNAYLNEMSVGFLVCLTPDDRPELGPLKVRYCPQPGGEILTLAANVLNIQGDTCTLALSLTLEQQQTLSRCNRTCMTVWRHTGHFLAADLALTPHASPKPLAEPLRVVEAQGDPWESPSEHHLNEQPDQQPDAPSRVEWAMFETPSERLANPNRAKPWSSTG